MEVAGNTLPFDCVPLAGNMKSESGLMASVFRLRDVSHTAFQNCNNHPVNKSMLHVMQHSVFLYIALNNPTYPAGHLSKPASC